MKKFIEKPNNIEYLYALVVEECKLIKEHFTSQEIDNLKYEEVKPDNEQTCIYGIMTGNCNSVRVNNFIQENLNTLVIGEHFGEEDNPRSIQFMTPLEVYIYGSQDYYEDDTLDYPEDCKERIEKVLKLLV